MTSNTWPFGRMSQRIFDSDIGSAAAAAPSSSPPKPDTVLTPSKVGAKRDRSPDSDSQQSHTAHKRFKTFFLRFVMTNGILTGLTRYRLKDHQDFSDLTLKCSSHEWRVHRVIASSHSEFIRAACSGGFKVIYYLLTISIVLDAKIYIGGSY